MLMSHPQILILMSFFLYDLRFWIGGTYRFGSKLLANSSLSSSLEDRDGLVIMLDYNINEKFRVGYAYNMTTLYFKVIQAMKYLLDILFPVKYP